MNSSVELPPGPRTAPILQLLRYSLRPFAFIDDCARRFGTPCTIRLAGFPPIVLLSDPQSVREALQGDPAALHSGEANAFLIPLVGEQSVLVLDEAAHAKQRATLAPPLRGERMRGASDAMCAAAEAEIATWPVGRPFRIDAAMRRITLRVILKVAFGAMPEAETREWETLFESIMRYARTRWALLMVRAVPHRLFVGSRWAPYYRELGVLERRLVTFVAKRRAAAADIRGDAVLDELLAARHADGAPLGDAEIRDALVTIVVAGYETTSAALTWAWTDLARRPDVADRAAAEARAAFADDATAEEALDRLPYTDAVVRESLRLRHVLPIVVRRTTRPLRLGGRDYPADISLAPCPRVVHRDPRLYPDPDRFDPERFLARKFAPHEWFPFGGGHRHCLGAAFALQEMKAVLAVALRRFRFVADPARFPAPRREGLILVPDDGGLLTATSPRS